MRHRPHPSPTTVAALLIGASLLVGCGAPPDRPGGPVPVPSAAPSAAPDPDDTIAPPPVLPPPPSGPAPPVDTTRPAPPRSSAPPTVRSPAAPGRTTGAPTRTASVSPPPGCAGEPAAAEVVRLLRAEELLPERASVSVGTGPLCADGWQYTVVRVPGRDPLQVVTAGDPGDLRLIAAGTEVCTPRVAAEAPAAVAAVAGCVG